ncbi:esterase/lipase family protein [Streptomyces roseoverticillatus]|uniref:esterase/lipase family protein n=1 Tax=Streptomyces roseoverticillatus TaxID=66429 RepID=UPI0004C1AB9A|nr:alpha/beta fold hydrolase [Streptomyces roseoverticillatus]
MFGIRRASRLVCSLLSALTLTLAIGSTASAADRPATVSSGWNDFSCKPSAAHPRPVVLVHGTLGNATDNWLVMAPYLVKRGYCVFSLDYGKLPGVPVLYGLGPIDKSAEELSAYVDKVRAATGVDKVDMVGHSQGGMMPRYYINFLGGASKVNHLIGLAPSSHGTTMMGLTKLMDSVPGARKVLGGMTPGLTDQALGSDFLNRLNASPDTMPGVEYSVIATKYDQIVTPHGTNFLAGRNVRNVLLQDLCPLDLSEHISIGSVDRIVVHWVANLLDPANAEPTTCTSVLS